MFLYALYAFSSMLQERYSGNVENFLSDLNKYNSTYELSDEEIESLGYFLSYFSVSTDTIDGKEKNISVTRGIVNSSNSKSQVLENLNMADEDNWTTIEHRINEVASNVKENTVYVWHWHKSLNTTFDLEFEQNVVTRFQFNDSGKVISRADLSEERLAQSQLGFSLKR